MVNWLQLGNACEGRHKHKHKLSAATGRTSYVVFYYSYRQNLAGNGDLGRKLNQPNPAGTQYKDDNDHPDGTWSASCWQQVRPARVVVDPRTHASPRLPMHHACIQNQTRAPSRVHQTGEPVRPVRPGSSLGRYQTGPNSKFKFKFKIRKISKNTLRCDESNGVKFSQKFVHLVQFAGI